MIIERKGLALKREGDDPADIYLDDSNNLALVFDAEAVGQHARQRLMTFEKEWFLDKDAGVTWLTQILGFDYDPVLAESLTKAEILETDGVTEIDSFSVRFDQTLRHLKSDNIFVRTEYNDSGRIQV